MSEWVVFMVTIWGLGFAMGIFASVFKGADRS